MTNIWENAVLIYNAHSLEGLQKHPPEGAWKLILTFYDLFTASSKWVLRKIFFNFVKRRNSKNEVRFNKHCRRLEIKLKYLQWVESARRICNIILVLCFGIRCSIIFNFIRYVWRLNENFHKISQCVKSSSIWDYLFKELTRIDEWPNAWNSVLISWSTSHITSYSYIYICRQKNWQIVRQYLWILLIIWLLWSYPLSDQGILYCVSQGRIIISFGRHISILHKRKVQMPIEGFFKTANTFDDWEPSKRDLSLSFCIC